MVGVSETLFVVDRPAFLDGSGPMVVMRVSEEAEARELLAPDPWCSGGRDIQGIGRIRPWTISLDGR
jgi:hypothetical protein